MRGRSRARDVTRGRALPGDRHVPLRDGASARPRPSRKRTLPLVACLANQLARRVPATMRACFQTISGGGQALPRSWEGSGRRLVFGAVTQRGSGGLWPPVGARRCQSARPARAGCDAEERRARVCGGCGGGWPRGLRWVPLFGPRFAPSPALEGPAGGALNNGSIAPAGPAPPSERAEVGAAELSPRPWS